MSKYVGCAINGCLDIKSSRHRFPNPHKQPERFKKWIIVSGNAMLFELDPDKVYSNRRVCHVHFQESDITSNQFIARDSIPSLRLPQPLELPLQENIDPTESSTLDKGVSEPASSASHFDKLISLPCPSSQTANNPEVSIEKDVAEPMLIKRRKITYRGQLSNTECGNKANIMQTVRTLKKQSYVLRKRNFTLRQRFRKAKQMFLNNPLCGYNNLNPVLLNFCRSQLNLAKYNKRGRRYSVQDKLFALSLYKQSGRSYRFLTFN
ncbi:uncharacterized protein [Onthophagus taurus]|uniref:uncharacterized protein n=1 Tax=Onthophagus taurus TaxID=166361 RepID=UPI0039BDF80B